MNWRRIFTISQRAAGYFTSTAGAVALFLTIIEAFTGGLSLVITVPVSIGVGLFCGCFGARNAIIEEEEQEHTRLAQEQQRVEETKRIQVEEQERKVAIEHLQDIKEDLAIVANGMCKTPSAPSTEALPQPSTPDEKVVSLHPVGMTTGAIFSSMNQTPAAPPIMMMPSIPVNDANYANVSHHAYYSNGIIEEIVEKRTVIRRAAPLLPAFLVQDPTKSGQAVSQNNRLIPEKSMMK